jgi:hypothetical protein
LFKCGNETCLITENGSLCVRLGSDVGAVNDVVHESIAQSLAVRRKLSLGGCHIDLIARQPGILAKSI